MSTDHPTAHLTCAEDDSLVLVDPAAAAMVHVINDHNCREVLRGQVARVRYFERRVADRGDAPEDVVIVVINVDTTYGGPLAASLMPGADWSEARARGETPYARGLAGREGMQEWLDATGLPTASKLRDTLGLAVIVVDHEHAAVFAVFDLDEG